MIKKKPRRKLDLWYTVDFLILPCNLWLLFKSAEKERERVREREREREGVRSFVRKPALTIVSDEA